MRLARVIHDGSVWLARLEGSAAVLLVEESNHPAADVLREALADGVDLDSTGTRVGSDAVSMLAPAANPSKIIAVGLNYRAHADESQMETPPAPLLFAKTPNTVLGPDAEVMVAVGSTTQLDYEGEMAAIIGLEASRVPVATALDHVFGYTVSNDVSARDAQFADGQWTRGKSFDGFCPLGPWLVTADELGDPQNLELSTVVNGVEQQRAGTDAMIFPVAELVSYISQTITLVPGDVILTGTPEGVGFAQDPPVYLADGHEVTVTVRGIGTLRNRIRFV
jgi:2-keto-4-pentenoate hydratase/2-oxohepta-3-ene-1,7-dioic acid hydratase in catechol pathway